MKVAGTVLFIIGIIGVLVFGVQALNDSESFNVFGLDIAISKANWTPLLISGLIAVVGIVLPMAAKRAN
jgi:hypothetical protein